jgi:ABC-type phosphate transport system substrate-binding protein
VLDREALALIFCGAITHWDDDAIKAPNTDAVKALLPHQQILVGYSDNAGISVPAVFKGALSSFSSQFKDALALANDTFAGLFPNNATGQSAGSSASSRVTWLQV